MKRPTLTLHTWCDTVKAFDTDDPEIEAHSQRSWTAYISNESEVKDLISDFCKRVKDGFWDESMDIRINHTLYGSDAEIDYISGDKDYERLLLSVDNATKEQKDRIQKLVDEMMESDK